MLKLSIHMFFIATLLTSVATFAIGDQKDLKDRASKTEADVAIQQSVRDAFNNPGGDVKLEGDKMLDAARSVFGIKRDATAKVDPELRKITILNVAGSEELFAKATPETIALVKQVLGTQKVNPVAKKAVADQYFAKLTALNIILHGKDGVKDWDPNMLKQMPGAYSIDAERNEVGFAKYALLAKLTAVLDGKESSPTKSMLDGAKAWLKHLNPKMSDDDIDAKAQDLLKCTGVKTVGA